MAATISLLRPISQEILTIDAWFQRRYLGFLGRPIKWHHSNFCPMTAILNSKMAAYYSLFWPISPMLSDVGAHNQSLYLGFWGRPIRWYRWIFRPMAAILNFKMAASMDLFWAIIPIILNIDAHNQRLSLGFWGRPIRIWHCNFRHHIEFQDGRHH